MFIETIGKWSVLVLLAGILAGFIIFIYYLKKRIEAKRIDEIVSHQDEWGREMCKWLMVKGIHTTDTRIAEIMQWYSFLGAETCRKLILKTISIGMTDKMVLLSLGKPTRIDNQAVSERGEKFRWVYNIPRRRAAMIWFKDGKVTKIENLPSYTHVHTQPQKQGDWLLNTEVKQREQQLQVLSKRISSPRRATSLANLQRVKKTHFLRGGRL